MLATAAANVTQVRNIAICAAVIASVLLLLHSFHVGPRDLEHTTRQSLQVINNFTPSRWRGQQSKVTKVTALFGQENELYEAAIHTHDEHNRLHGYDMKVLRERIVGNFWSKPAYLLSLVVEELAKPEEERTEWIVWVGSDIILLNPHIPLEIFLPPDDFDHVHFLGTQDSAGLNTGVFFLRVHEWSVRMLIEVLATPKNEQALDHVADKETMALEMILTDPSWRKAVFYQPRTWFNAYQLDANRFEGNHGHLLVHFHELEGDKWSSMASYLDQVSLPNSTWRVPLSMTTYESEIDEYWNRLRAAERLLDQSERKISDEAVAEAARRLGSAFHFDADVEQVMLDAMDNLKEAMGV